MSRNNKNSSTATIIVLVVLLAASGYFLSKNPAKDSSPNANQTTSTNDHHGDSATAAVNSNALNALVGEPLPDIPLSDKEGKNYTAEAFKGKNTVLFFNEGLMCYPACWNQMAAFGSDARFNDDQIQAVSVVADSAKDWQTAVDKMPQLARATTMFDTSANASRQLGLLTTASSMHRGSLPGHTYIVVDKEGIVRYVFDDPKMAIANDMLFSKIAELE